MGTAVFTVEDKMLLRIKIKKMTQQIAYNDPVYCLFDSHGFMHYDSGSRSQTVNQGFSLSILQCLQEKHCERNNWNFGRNTFAHKKQESSFSTAIPLPSSPADTYLFPELKVSVMGCQC